MIATDPNVADSDAAKGFAAIQGELESVAAKGFSLYWGRAADDSPVKPRRGERTPKTLRFHFSSKGPNSGEVRFVSTLFDRLPLGHRQFLSAQTTSGVNLGQALLSAKENSLEVNLPAATVTQLLQPEVMPSLAFLKLGVEHIWLGVDHLLFVFGLLLLVQSPWMLFKTITAFTVAHSITLALATFGYVYLPALLLNAAIALSILILGVEVVRSRSGKTSITILHPWIVAFAFGLLHGFGFASGLSALGLPSAGIPLALVMFNVGVEIGQVSFVLLILILERSFRQLEIRWPRWVQALPGYTVGSLGAFWTIQRAAMLLGIIS